MDIEIEIPQYFLCPISLQIMKDPVTTVTGITYDRECIEQWLITFVVDANAAVCPVTKQPLTITSELTPNHMLRRLIQAWCIANASHGIDRIPTPKAPLQRSQVLKLVRDVNKFNNHILRLQALMRLEELANESEKNQKCMAEAGVAKSMVLFILRCFNEGNIVTGLEEALRILQLTWHDPTNEYYEILENNLDFVKSILWILQSHINTTAKTIALIVLKNVTEIASPELVESLDHDFFKQMVKLLHDNYKSPQTLKPVLHILIQTCPPGTNRMKIVETGAVFELIELELSDPEKRITDLIFNLLAHLCSCADGRQQLLKHAGGIALAAKRLLRNSPATDDHALCIMDSIAKYSATREVVWEMLRVGAVSKLCMVLQADCADYLKKKAREILRLHSNDWCNSPCIQIYLFTRYNR